MTRISAAFLFALLLLGPVPATAAALAIGYLELTDDPRYDDKWAYAGLLLAPGGRPFEGTEAGLAEAKINGGMVGLDFTLERAEAADAGGMLAALDRLQREKNIHLFLLDAPDDLVAKLGAATRGKDVLLFNISASGNELRNKECQPQLLHVVPSLAMQTDAMAQYLVARKWREILVLQGPLPADAELVGAFERSARRFGLKITDNRKFVVGNDPRNRDQNNLALLTTGVDYDVVYVADTDGEFGRYIPYATQKPRPVVGTAGLAAVGWDWSWERYGAPQLTRRFFRQAKRQMQTADWAAWAAVRIIGDAAVATRSTDLATLAAYIKSDKLAFDGSKGVPLNFRPWDNQLRQPILLATSNWVVERAPLPGFLHASNNLDTLGYDKPESACHF